MIQSEPTVSVTSFDGHCVRLDFETREEADAFAEHFIATRTDSQSTVIDLEKASWDALCKAAGESNWISPEYMANDWLADCARFLRTGEGITDSQSADAVEVLTCDVRLPPATVIRAGCTFDTLRLAMGLEGRPRHFDENHKAKYSSLEEFREHLAALTSNPIASDSIDYCGYVYEPDDSSKGEG
jgi:hypothetical protein